MNVVAAADVIAFVAFAVAFAFALCLPSRAPGVGPLVKYTLLAVVGLYVFASFSNALEQGGITPYFDVYEDFAEVLYVPLVAAVVFSRLLAERVLAAQSAEEQIRSQHELLAGVVNTTPAGILVATGAGEVTFANDVARDMLAHATDGQLDLAEIVREAPRPHLWEELGEGDAARYVSIRCTPLEPDEAGLTRAVLILVDISDRVRLDAELAEYRVGLEHAIDLRTAELLEANRQLHEAGHDRERFLTRMSHELRTPLNSIIGFSDIMLKGLSGELTDDQRTQLGMVKMSGGQLLDLVNNVLDMIRIEAGHGTLSLSEVDLNDRLQNLVASMSALAMKHRIGLEFEPAAVPPIRTDADKLDQVVRNLVSNAIKFTDPGGRVKVTLAREGGGAVIAVSDTGIGIAPGDQDRIFGAFQQADVPDRVRPEGTGLGLAICRELCGILGCDIELSSSSDEGSTFTVSVPVEPADAPDAL